MQATRYRYIIYILIFTAVSAWMNSVRAAGSGQDTLRLRNRNVFRLENGITRRISEQESLTGPQNIRDSLAKRGPGSAQILRDTAAGNRIRSLLDLVENGTVDSTGRRSSWSFLPQDTLQALLPLDSLLQQQLNRLLDSGMDSASAFRNLADPEYILQIRNPGPVLTAKEQRRLYRDSLRAYKDSVIRSLPRVLETYLFPDSIVHQRMFIWKTDGYLNKPEIQKPDTTFNDNFYDYPFFRKDVNAVWLGVSGSPVQYYNYFKRESTGLFPFFDPYLPYTYTPETMPFYNVKTPYTELAYWGTLFANKQKEETNIKFMHTQNITPAFNFNLLYQRYGAAGILDREKTDNRTLALTANYLGKRYILQGGYLYNGIKRQENGGISDLSMVLDTIVDSRIVPVALQDADTRIKKNTFFVSHSYGVPVRWFSGKRKLRDGELSAEIADTLPRMRPQAPPGLPESAPGSFSPEILRPERNGFPQQEREAVQMPKDSLALRDSLEYARGNRGTMVYFGHHGEFTTYTKLYTDQIGLNDRAGRDLYRDLFYINPTESSDSVRIMQLENRFYIRLQPWSDNAIVSKVDGGIGHQFLNLYGFRPDYFLSGNKNVHQNNLYVYFGASGQVKKYFAWEGFGKYQLAGYYQNDFAIDGRVRFSAYPVKQGIHLTGRIHLSQTRPEYFYNHYYSNHYIWENDFGKETETRIEAKLEVPDYKLEAFFGYSLLKNNIYLDTVGTVRQNKQAMSVLTAYLQKNFRAWKFHFDNQVLFQISSREEVLPLPKLALNLRYYLEIELVKNVLTAQLGANATFNTKYYAPAYSPALGLFHNQDQMQIGNTPYIDAFVNLQWKRASIFVKYVNAAQDWPRSDYFSAYRYLRPQTALKFGIHWPFYIK